MFSRSDRIANALMVDNTLGAGLTRSGVAESAAKPNFAGTASIQSETISKLLVTALT